MFLPLLSHTTFSALSSSCHDCCLNHPLALEQYASSMFSALPAAQTLPLSLSPISPQVLWILLSVSQVLHPLSSSSATALLQPQHLSHEQPQVYSLASCFQTAIFNLQFCTLAVRRHWHGSQHIGFLLGHPIPPHRDKVLVTCWAIKATSSSGPCQASPASPLATLAGLTHCVLATNSLQVC